MDKTNAAIGVFDSGVGGLTVLRRIMALLPNESVHYLGDTARVPYGTKSRDTVIRYAQGCARLLMEQDIKMLVVACNTASAFAVEALQARLDIPVVGVVEPGARAAATQTKSGRIGVISTASTLQSGAYPDAIQRVLPDATVHSYACPLFVPLAEEGWTTGDVPRQVATQYLAPLQEAGIDTLVLGCTHYPLLQDVITQVMGSTVTLVDSAAETAQAVQSILLERDLAKTDQKSVHYRYFVTDAPESFVRTGAAFLGHDLDSVQWIDY